MERKRRPRQKEFQQPLTIGDAVGLMHLLPTCARQKAIAVNQPYLQLRFGGSGYFREELPPVISYPIPFNPGNPINTVPGFIFGAEAIRTQGRPEMLDEWQVRGVFSLWHGKSNNRRIVSVGTHGRYGSQEDHVYTVIEGNPAIFHSSFDNSGITSIHAYDADTKLIEVPILQTALNLIQYSLNKKS